MTVLHVRLNVSWTHDSIWLVGGQRGSVSDLKLRYFNLQVGLAFSELN